MLSTRGLSRAARAPTDFVNLSQWRELLLHFRRVVLFVVGAVDSKAA